MNVILCGALGKMGAEMTSLLSSGFEGTRLCAAVDPRADERDGGVFFSLDDVCVDADVMIDFSHHGAATKICEFAIKNGVPAVIATTGHTPSEIEQIKRAAERVPVFYCANMAAGTALLCDFSARAASFFPQADIEITEIHRRGKLDAPSGTALMLKDEIRRENGARAVGIHSLRLGNTVGTHSVIICAEGETLTITHSVNERAVFARGAIKAAKFLMGKKAGLYDMRSLIEGR